MFDFGVLIGLLIAIIAIFAGALSSGIKYGRLFVFMASPLLFLSVIILYKSDTWLGILEPIKLEHTFDDPIISINFHFTYLIGIVSLILQEVICFINIITVPNHKLKKIIMVIYILILNIFLNYTKSLMLALYSFEHFHLCAIISEIVIFITALILIYLARKEYFKRV